MYIRLISFVYTFDFFFHGKYYFVEFSITIYVHDIRHIAAFLYLL